MNKKVHLWTNYNQKVFILEKNGCSAIYQENMMDKTDLWAKSDLFFSFLLELHSAPWMLIDVRFLILDNFERKHPAMMTGHQNSQFISKL